MQSGKAKLWILAKTLIVFFVSGIGFLSLFSDISVEALMPLEKGNLKSVPIQIKNNSYVSIYDVSYTCRARSLINEKGGKIIVYNKGVTPHNFGIKKLNRNEATTVGLPFTFVAGKIVSADFDFVVTYKPFWLSPFTLRKPYRFASSKNNETEVFLLKKAVSEN